MSLCLQDSHLPVVWQSQHSHIYLLICLGFLPFFKKYYVPIQKEKVIKRGGWAKTALGMQRLCSNEEK